MSVSLASILHSSHARWSPLPSQCGVPPFNHLRALINKWLSNLRWRFASRNNTGDIEAVVIWLTSLTPTPAGSILDMLTKASPFPHLNAGVCKNYVHANLLHAYLCF